MRPRVDNSPFFIVGSGRSGTTLLRVMLCRHPRIEIPPETWFLLPLTRELPHVRTLSRAETRRAVELILGDYRWPDMGIDAGLFRARAARLEPPTLRGLMEIIYGEQRQRSGKPRCGDKTPPYIEIVPEIAEIFPEARFIHLIRDGREVAASFIDAHFRGAVWEPDFEWRRAIRAGAALRGSPLAPRIMELHYETLVRDPETALRTVCAFLGEAYDPAMLAFQEGLEERIPQRERRIHASLARPLGMQPARRLSLAERFVIEACLGAELRVAGYAPRFSHPLCHPLAAAVRRAMPVIGPPLRRIVQALRRRGLLRRQIYI